MTADDTIRFLLVDDLEENLVALEALLQREGLTCVKARSGEEALELLLVHDFALALLDVQMPGMNGFELAEFMRGSERSRHVPIIFLTAGTADQQRRFRGYEAGAVDFIQKPIEADILRSKAAVFFDLHDQRRQLTVQRDELEALAEALRLADRRKNDFLAVLGHELRNPIMAFGSGLGLIERRRDPEITAMVHAQMGRHVKQMSRLVEDLLDIARIDQGKISLSMERVRFQEVIAVAVEAIDHQVEAAGHALHINAPDDPVWVEGDPVRLAQIVSNLLSNAIKYTPGGGTIGLTLEIVGDQVRLDVEDSGLGIPSDMRSKIFEMFAQVDGRGQAHEGLGIGLALVRQLVELHGGQICLEYSEPGRGSTFCVKLPAIS